MERLLPVGRPRAPGLARAVGVAVLKAVVGTVRRKPGLTGEHHSQRSEGICSMLMEEAIQASQLLETQ